VFHTVRASVDHLKAHGDGGSIVITSSSAGLKGTGSDKAGGMAYTAAKRGLVGLMQVLANDLAQHWIRVNTIHPTGVATGMIMNDAMQALMASGSPDLAAMQNALPIPILQPEDIANAVAWLVSDQAKYVTGIALPIDAGFSVR
jgi:NAD(P)-dependent dehydrogenase (short-subunit alcohol dehydrogenase family)